jgi:hypothetical protein
VQSRRVVNVAASRGARTRYVRINEFTVGVKDAMRLRFQRRLKHSLILFPLYKAASNCLRPTLSQFLFSGSNGESGLDGNIRI